MFENCSRLLGTDEESFTRQLRAWLVLSSSFSSSSVGGELTFLVCMGAGFLHGERDMALGFGRI
jgi:hypothetical protein